MNGDDTGLILRGVQVRSLLVPLSPPLQTASGTVPEAPTVLIDLMTEQGITGRSYVFCYTPLVLAPMAHLVRNIVESVADQPLVPTELTRVLEARFRLLRPHGLVAMATAGLDMAVWDALAHAAGMPLVGLLGGRPTPVPAYASLRSMQPDAAAREATAQAELGFGAYKVKVGLDDLATDVAVVRAIRSAVGRDVRVAVDYNQSLTVPEAVHRIQVLQDEGLLWVEEPTAADDHTGHARIRDQVTAPVQIGESWWGTRDMVASIMAGASDLAMVDVTRIGGVTGWIQAAALAAGHSLPLSSHLYPEVSAHLLAVSPGAHLLEHLDIAAPLLTDPVQVHDGTLVAPDRPGTGIDWDEDAVTTLMDRSGPHGQTMRWSVP